MLKAAVIGATGYAGEELLKILVRHPEVEITHLVAKIDQPCAISLIFPYFAHILDLECGNEINVEEICKHSDVVFLALPHRVSMEIAPAFLRAGKKVIDFSADYRLKDTDEYEKWYGIEHKSKEFVQESVYGLCELNREKIRNARLIANPGCFPTGAILGCAPFFKAKIVLPEIILDAKTGVSGAGRKASLPLLFSEVNESFKAYKICQHQHSPEIVQEIENIAGESVPLIFVPHLIPVNRGILSAIYLRLKENISVFEAVDICRKFYHLEPFIRVRNADVFPEIKDVAYSNFCDIGIKISGKQLVIIAVIDNLVKGASGQAVQNLNLMFGLEETLGLIK
ncbi:MAG: N-acetyl-gamma-glutamyl-phosphate reductase [Candidatus Omnitrophota bacterium]|nr:MAG: N-acetyl-gamma-glutamyl-phosphate reductase [Candidatus Omnitrophota bacterium]